MVQRGGRDPNAKNGNYVGMLTLAIPRERARVLDVQETLQKLRSISKEGFVRLSFDAARGGPPCAEYRGCPGSPGLGRPANDRQGAVDSVVQSIVTGFTIYVSRSGISRSGTSVRSPMS